MSRADEIQIELLRRRSPQQRLAVTRGLTARVVALAQRAIGRNFPELDDVGRRVKFIEIHYGADLARRVEAQLRKP